MTNGYTFVKVLPADEPSESNPGTEQKLLIQLEKKIVIICAIS